MFHIPNRSNWVIIILYKIRRFEALVNSGNACEISLKFLEKSLQLSPNRCNHSLMPSYLYSQKRGLSKYSTISSTVNITSASMKFIGTNGFGVTDCKVLFFYNNATVAISPDIRSTSLILSTVLLNALAIAISTNPSYDPIRNSLVIILIKF